MVTRNKACSRCRRTALLVSSARSSRPGAGVLGRPPRAAFTLIEIMIVVSIIGLLLGIILPSLQGAKRSAKRVACAANLRQVGQALQMYLAQSKDFLPVVAMLPSLPPPGGSPRPAIVDVLLDSVEHQRDVFRCPSDLPGATQRPDPNYNKSFFETEGSSYVFNGYLCGKKLAEVVRSERVVDYFGATVNENQVWLMHDYTTFHGPAAKPGAMNYLYIDGHVGDLER